ncbi:hypothetical protein GCM10010286_10720 [Streptomyces toxytricini]|nr:hypothetical protein GCM10010286_10720 [Streptomyces toxytricini]
MRGHLLRPARAAAALEQHRFGELGGQGVEPRQAAVVEGDGAAAGLRRKVARQRGLLGAVRVCGNASDAGRGPLYRFGVFTRK